MVMNHRLFKERTEKTPSGRKSSFKSEKKLIDLQLYFYLFNKNYLFGFFHEILSFCSGMGQKYESGPERKMLSEFTKFRCSSSSSSGEDQEASGKRPSSKLNCLLPRKADCPKDVLAALRASTKASSRTFPSRGVLLWTLTVMSAENSTSRKVEGKY